MTKWIRISPKDNVEVLADADDTAEIPLGHKRALCDLACGDVLLKYGYPIGRATKAIAKGEWVHSHNMTSLLESGEKKPSAAFFGAKKSAGRERFFEGYRRPDGSVGTRNEVWIIPTVGCVGNISREISKLSQYLVGDSLDAIVGFAHPYGCSQLGEDAALTVKALAGIIRNPNAAGVLVLGLGCENSGIEKLKEELGSYDEKRLRFLKTQDVEDELAAGLALVKELADYAKTFHRETCLWSELVIGMKCGGSDGLSGITANPMLGRLADGLCASGGSVILTEVPEMFGAEALLYGRAADEKVLSATRNLIESFYEYYRLHGEPVNENPSPGNLAGGITTLEEKSLGCVQKGGMGTITGVLSYGEALKEKGLNLLWGPGNDLISCAALSMSGANLILFSTGRGTPFGSPVPTVKIATNSELARKKQAWIDFDAGALLQEEASAVDEALLEEVLAVASGKKTKSEGLDRSDLAIFKDGVIL